MAAVLLGPLRIRVAVAAASVFVLAAGFTLRPGTPAPVAPLPEQPSPILRETVTSREPLAPFATFQSVADRVVRVTVRLLPPQRPLTEWSDWKPADPVNSERYGVLIGGNRVLAEAGDLSEGSPVVVQFGNAGAISGWVVVRYPRARLALVAVEPAGGLAAPPRADAAPRAGDVVAGIGPGDGGPAIVPLIVTDVRDGVPRVTGDLQRFLGMAVFTASGEWVGSLADGTAGWTRIVTPEHLADAPQEEVLPPVPIGWSLQSTGVEGIVIADLMPDGRAERAGFRRGDVLVAIGDERPATLAEAAHLLAQGQTGSVRILIRRAGRQRTLIVPPPIPKP